MHGYGVLERYAFEPPKVENDWTVPLSPSMHYMREDASHTDEPFPILPEVCFMYHTFKALSNVIGHRSLTA